MILKKIDLSGGYGGHNDPVNRVPQMTSNTLPSGVCTDSMGSANAYKAFDRYVTSAIQGLLINSTTGWVQYQFASPVTITSYRFAWASTNVNPRAWTLKGSNNGTDWTTIHTQPTITPGTEGSWYSTNVPSPSYSYYRFDVSSSGGAASFYINRLGFCTASDAGTQYTYTAPNGVTVTSSHLTTASGSTPALSYYMEKLFNNTIPAGANITYQYYSTQVKTTVTLTFDLNAISPGTSALCYIRVAPKSDTNSSCNYRILSSADNSVYSERVPIQNYPTSTAFGTFPGHNVNIGERYLRVEFTSANAAYNTCIAEIELWQDSGYTGSFYVSQQRGSDSNDGRTPATPWATINKAVSSIGVGLDQEIKVYVGPGIYRELISIKDGLSQYVYYIGDPEAVYLTDDIPGIVRITSYQADEQTPIAGYSAYLFSCNGKLIDCSNFHIDCSAHGTSGGRWNRCQVTAANICFVDSVRAIDCIGYGKRAFYTGVSAGTCYNCIAYSSEGGFYGHHCHSCLAFGGFVGFYLYCPPSNYTYSYNCVAMYCVSGFQQGRMYNDLAIFCNTAYTNIFGGAGYKYVGCGSVGAAGATVGSAAYFDIDLSTMLTNGLIDRGTLVPDIDKDLLGLERVAGNGTVDIGPIEQCKYSIDWTNFYENAPAIKIEQAGQLKLIFKVNAGQYVAKRVFVKHVSTASDKKPQLIIRGQGVERTFTAVSPNNTWEQLTIGLVPEVDGVVEMILVTRDTDPASYSLFSDPL
jgi:hypothetical protein